MLKRAVDPDREKVKTNQIANERYPAVHTFALQWSDNINFISVVNMLLQLPFKVAWLLRSTYDLSTNKEAICLSADVRESDFSIASQGQVLITPPSDPDHRSPR